ncbi:MAG: hypothetical protein JWM21_2971 [Acidobacteria bacterium]|nr:hypothetical protein [Acidobacteriota bacterium]
MQYHGDSVKEASKSQNEDVYFSKKTKYGLLCVVLDFAGYNYENFGLKLRSDFATLIDQLDTLEGMTSELFLGYVAKELNNYVYRMGQEFCAGRLNCVAALCLLDANVLTCLTYGDARVNIFDGNNLILLNGAKYQTLTIVSEPNEHLRPIEENPEQLGAKYFDSPLVDRTQRISLKDSDTVLMFSDGVEEVLAPPDRLRELRRLASAEPREIYEALIQLTAAVQDDRTLAVIKGPYEAAREDPLAKRVQQEMSELQNQLGTINENQNELNNDLAGRTAELERQIRESSASLSALSSHSEMAATGQLASLGQLKSRIEALENRGNSKKEGKGGRKSNSLDADAVKQTIDQLMAADPTWLSQKRIEPAERPAQPNIESTPGTILGMHPPRPDPGDSINWRRVIPTLATAIILISLGFFLAWLTGYMSGSGGTGELWRVKASENTVAVIRTDPNGQIDRVELMLATPIRGGAPQEKEMLTFKQVGEYLTSLGVTQRGAGETASRTPRPQNDDVILEVPVMPGDTLEKIAAKYNVTKEDILKTNPEVKNGKLSVGQKLKLPNKNANGGSQ